MTTHRRGGGPTTSVIDGCAVQLYDCNSTNAQNPTNSPSTTAPPAGGVNLDNPAKKDVAMQIVSAAENSSLDWRAQSSYIEDIGDGRGYTAGIIGFCSGTGDMLELVEAYTATKPGNVLAKYLPALRSAVLLSWGTDITDDVVRLSGRPLGSVRVNDGAVAVRRTRR